MERNADLNAGAMSHLLHHKTGKHPLDVCLFYFV